jgi:hypothetical protein
MSDTEMTNIITQCYEDRIHDLINERDEILRHRPCRVERAFSSIQEMEQYIEDRAEYGPWHGNAVTKTCWSDMTFADASCLDNWE